jgi:diguanylate cyclase (GGDEF)-like protein
MKIVKKFDLISLILITLFIPMIVISYIFIEGSQEKAGMLKIFLASVTFMVILILLIRTFILKKVLRPLREISKISSLIAESSLKSKVEVSSSDELEELTTSLSKIAGSLDEKMERLEISISKEQRVVRELAILSEMVGAIVSERNFETMLDTFLERTRSLLKSEYSGIFIFEGENKELKMFRTTFAKDVSLDCAMAMADGPFRNVLETFIPLRVNAPMENTPSDHPEVKNMIALPLAIAGDKLSGLLILINKEGGFSEEDEDTLFNFSFQAFQILAVHNELTHLATTDGLTGLNNHRVFQERLNEEIERARRYRKNLSLLMVDIDHFKSFNDTYGHQAGDEVLRAIASIIKENLRCTDFAARYGGEEFVVILTETDCDQAQVAAERLRQTILEYPFRLESGEHARLAVSVGYACYPKAADTKALLIKRADEALYSAKEAGRNRVYGYSDST